MKATVELFVEKDEGTCRGLRRSNKPSFEMSFDIGLQSL